MFNKIFISENLSPVKKYLNILVIKLVVILIVTIFTQVLIFV